MSALSPCLLWFLFPEPFLVYFFPEKFPETDLREMNSKHKEEKLSKRALFKKKQQMFT